MIRLAAIAFSIFLGTVAAVFGLATLAIEWLLHYDVKADPLAAIGVSVMPVVIGLFMAIVWINDKLKYG